MTPSPGLLLHDHRQSSAWRVWNLKADCSTNPRYHSKQKPCHAVRGNLCCQLPGSPRVLRLVLCCGNLTVERDPSLDFWASNNFNSKMQTAAL